MKLDDFKEVFEQVLSRDDFSKLEMAVNFGLELEKGSVSQLPDAGSDGLRKIVQELPNHFKRFKRIRGARSKLARDGGKGFKDFFPPPMEGSGYDRRSWNLWFFSFIGSFAMMFLGLSGSGATSGTLLSVPFSVLGCVGGGICVSDGVQVFLADHDVIEHYYHPFAVPVAAAKYFRARTRERRIEKKERCLVRKLGDTYLGSPDYSRKWFGREKALLLKKFGEADKSFALRFREVEARLHPYDRILIHKGVEEVLSKEYLGCDKTLEGLLPVSRKLFLAERAGVQVSELRAELLAEIKGKRKVLKRVEAYL